MNSEIKIRRAQPGDESQIAQVHIQAWQEAYAGLLPQNFLDQLESSYERRLQWWTKATTEKDKAVFVAELENQIIGFCAIEAARDKSMEGFGELTSIYLLKKYQGQGIGQDLLSAGFNQLREWNYAKAYCWVLEKNTTIKFYEKFGATFNGTRKTIQIGGESFNELAYGWSDLNIGEYNWKPLSLEEIKNVFQKFQAPWIIAGGWAIDLFLEKQTREHSDVDVLINRKNQLNLQDLLADWDAWVADPPGTLRPIKKGEWFDKGIQDIWVRKTPTDPWQFQIMLFDTEEDFWIFKRDESIRRKLDTVILINKDGFRILSPEIQLLYKSKAIREKDQQDFEIALNSMSATQKQWLKSALIKVYKGSHPWINTILL